MFSPYLLSVSILISTQIVTTFLESASILAPHLPSLTLPNQHYVMPKTSPLQSPRFFRKPFSSSSENDDKDLLSMILNGKDKLTTPHPTSPDQYVSDMGFPSDDYLKKAFERNSQLTLRQTVRENIREIDSLCLKLLAKRTTGNGEHDCVNMETFVTDLQEYIADKSSNSLTTKNLFLESQTLLYQELVDTSGVTDNMAVSLIYHLHEMMTEVKRFNLDPQLFDGAEVIKIIGTKGRSITHWNAKGNWETLVDYKDGKHSFINKEHDESPQQKDDLLRFLDLNFPQGPNGKSYGNEYYQKEEELQNAYLKSLYQELDELTEIMEINNLEEDAKEVVAILFPSAIFRSTYQVDPTSQITVKFFKDGSSAATFNIFSTLPEATSLKSAFVVENLVSLLNKPSLIKGGVKRDINGTVREILLGKLNPLTNRYSLADVQMKLEDTRTTYVVRSDRSGKASFNRSQYLYSILSKTAIFRDQWELPELPIVSQSTTVNSIDGQEKSGSSSSSRPSIVQPDDVSSEPRQKDSFSNLDKIIYDELVSLRGFTPDEARFSITAKDDFVSELRGCKVDKKLLNGTVVTKVFGANGHSIIYFSSKGKIDSIMKFDNGEYSVTNNGRILQNHFPGKILELEKFLNRYLPGNINGRPYENLQKDLEKLKAELKKDSIECNDAIDLIPALMLQNAYGEETIFRVSVQFSSKGGKNDFRISSYVFPRIQKSSQVPEPISISKENNMDEKNGPSENVEKVKTSFKIGPAASVDEEVQSDGVLKRFKVAIQDPSTRLYKIKSFAENMAFAAGSLFLYETLPWVVSTTHLNDFDDFFNGLSYQFDNDEIDTSEPRLYETIFDETDHNSHESIFSRIFGSHDGRPRSQSLRQLLSDITHGAQQDAHDLFEECQNYVEDHSGIHCRHSNNDNNHKVTDLIRTTKTHVPYVDLPNFKEIVAGSLETVFTGMIWSVFRSLPALDQVEIVCVCLCVAPLLPNALVASFFRQLVSRYGIGALTNLFENQIYQSCVRNSLPYLGVLLGDPTHLVSGLTSNFLKITMNQMASHSVQEAVNYVRKKRVPSIESGENQYSSTKVEPKTKKPIPAETEKPDPNESEDLETDGSNVNESANETPNQETQPDNGANGSNSDKGSISRPRANPYNTFYVTPTGDLKDYYEFSGERRPMPRREKILFGPDSIWKAW